jgi:hypothetical protein
MARLPQRGRDAARARSTIATPLRRSGQGEGYAQPSSLIVVAISSPSHRIAICTSATALRQEIGRVAKILNH